jgi:hypothetical protein
MRLGRTIRALRPANLMIIGLIGIVIIGLVIIGWIGRSWTAAGGLTRGQARRPSKTQTIRYGMIPR